MGVTRFEHDIERQRVLLWHFDIIEQPPFCFIDPEPPQSSIDRYGNGGSMLEVYLVSHECDGSIEADVSIELWASTDNEPDWWVGWKLEAPLGSGWPFSIDFCPFCGIHLTALHRYPSEQ